MKVRPEEEVTLARENLRNACAVPDDARPAIAALLGKIAQVGITEQTVQQWRDVVEAGHNLEPSSPEQVAELIATIESAPSTPPPPSGCLQVDMYALDAARALNMAFDVTEGTEQSQN